VQPHGEILPVLPPQIDSITMASTLELFVLFNNSKVTILNFSEIE
jgi:hypothetical protein